MPPTSGMKPIPTSGMAIFVVSVTTRTLPWALMPTAAHRDAVHQGDVRLGVAADRGVEQILVVPEAARLIAAGLGVVVDRDDVSAGAQATLTRAGDDDGRHRVVAFPLPQRRVDRRDHRMGQRVDRLGSVERDQSDSVVDLY
ncbi:hypothetical protein MDUV_54460 [Mycolicibacterium duvalii]|uniref:Uncharacterized protein n=1 Tax=Mycolicibacterium duvalii TaxID=39688 RepID=A0A7I7K939_9MYCO|nr:hypothetical protein MDUV_54460 [Mycolicibacterium duvalii]